MKSDSRIHAFHPESYGDLKTAVRTLLHTLGGEAKAADLCRVSKSTLSEYGNPTYADRNMPVDIALALEEAAGDFPITRHMAAAHSALVVALPSAADTTDWVTHLTRIGRESGDVFHRAGEYLANDGEIDNREAPTLLKELDELILAVADMREAVRMRLSTDNQPKT